MASLSEQQDYREDVTALTVLALRDLMSEMGNPATQAADTAADLIRETVPFVITEHGPQAAALAADYYDEYRYAALGAAAVAYTATLAPEAPEDVVQDALGWALAPLFDPTLDPASTASRVAGLTEKLVRAHARKTTLLNASQDPIGTRYARVARPDACAFCRMLATRGADYRSAESALMVVGEIDPRDPWRQDRIRGPRGTQPLGEKFHYNCRCDLIAVFPGETHEPAPQIAEWMEQYLEAAKATGTTRGDLNALLAKWRELYGTR